MSSTTKTTRLENGGCCVDGLLHVASKVTGGSQFSVTSLDADQWRIVLEVLKRDEYFSELVSSTKSGTTMKQYFYLHMRYFYDDAKSNGPIAERCLKWCVADRVVSRGTV
jgi:glutaredoxin-related protein